MHDKNTQYILIGSINVVSLQAAADVALQKMKDRVDGYGGIIAIDKNGNFGKAFNTAVMVWVSIKNNRMESGMEPGEVDVDIIGNN